MDKIHYDIIVKSIPIPLDCKSANQLENILIEKIEKELEEDGLLRTLAGELKICEIQRNYQAFQPFCHAFLCFEHTNNHLHVAALLNGKIIVQGKKLTTSIAFKPAFHSNIPEGFSNFKKYCIETQKV